MKAIDRLRSGAIHLSLLAIAGSVLPAMAETLIQRQQAELNSARAIWEAPRVPAGMQNGPLRATSLRDSGTQALSLRAHNVNFAVTGDIGFYVDELAASLEPVTPGEPVQFDDPRTFIIRVHHGEVVVPPKALTALFNQHILEYSPRPLDDMQVSTLDGALSAKGGLKLWSWFPGFWLGAKMTGPITLSKANELIFTPEDVRLFNIPLGGLLRTLGIKLSWLLSLEREGVALVDSHLVLNHRKVFPPPALAGNIASVSMSTQGLHLSFADNKAAKFVAPPERSKSYLWVQSGDARLFDVIATNANVMIVDEKKDDVLLFDLYGYRKQVNAGKLYMDQTGTIIARIPSYNRLPQLAANDKAQ